VPAQVEAVARDAEAARDARRQARQPAAQEQEFLHAPGQAQPAPERELRQRAAELRRAAAHPHPDDATAPEYL
jgi:hypothetical protein